MYSYEIYDIHLCLDCAQIKQWHVCVFEFTILIWLDMQQDDIFTAAFKTNEIINQQNPSYIF